MVTSYVWPTDHGITTFLALTTPELDLLISLTQPTQRDLLNDQHTTLHQQLLYAQRKAANLAR